MFKRVAADGFQFPSGRLAALRRIAAIGESAGEVVEERTKDGETIRKCATAHDLRRAFGFRWSRRVMPNVLRELMRHSSINTTMAFYVGQNAESTAESLWNAVDNKPGHTAESENSTREEIPHKTRA